MGYGGLPNFTEYDPAGHVLLDGTLGKNVQSFRTYLQPWSAQAPGVPVGRGQRLVGRGQLERRHERRLLAGARRRLGDDPRTGRERREGGFPDDDLGAGGQRLRRRAGARPQRRGARAPRDTIEGLKTPAQPCGRCSRIRQGRSCSCARASAGLARRSGSRRSPGLRGRERERCERARCEGRWARRERARGATWPVRAACRPS